MLDDFYKIRPGPVILICLCLLTALAMVFFALYALRAMGLNTIDYSVCMGETEYMRLSYCVGELARDHLKDPHWRAVQFVSYVLTAMSISAVAARLIPVQRMMVCGAASLIAALLAGIIFNPGTLVAFAAFIGGMLGALIVDYWLKRNNKK
jgi:hypothetical protein